MSRCVPKTIPALAACALLWSSSAQADPCADNFHTERPGATNGHWTVSPGCVQIESGVAVERVSSATGVSFPTLLRVGVADVLELRASSSIIGIAAPDEGDVEAIAPGAGLEVKITAVRAKDHKPGVGVLVGLTSVTNSDFVDALTPSTSLLFDWELVDKLWFATNANASGPPGATDDGRRKLVLGYAAVLSYDVLNWMSFYGNGFGGAPVERGSFSQWAGGGLAFYPPIDAFQLDVSADVEVTGDDHPLLLQAGVSAAF